MSITLSIPEKLEKVNNEKSKAKRIEKLKELDHDVLRSVLKHSFHPDIKFLLPEGKPPLDSIEKNTAPLGNTPSTIYQEARRFYLFVSWKDEPVHKTLKQHRRETLFVQMLEGMHPQEIDVLCAMKDKSLETLYKGITYDIVFKAFNDLLPKKEKKS